MHANTPTHPHCTLNQLHCILTARLRELSPWFYNVFIDDMCHGLMFLVACQLVAGGGRPEPVPQRLWCRSRRASPALARAGYDIAGSNLHMDLPDAEAGSFASWLSLANAANLAINLRPTEEQASAGKQATSNLPRVLNDIEIRKQNPVGGSGPEIKPFAQKRVKWKSCQCFKAMQTKAYLPLYLPSLVR
jgi:hypothetical protein